MPLLQARHVQPRSGAPRAPSLISLSERAWFRQYARRNSWHRHSAILTNQAFRRRRGKMSRSITAIIQEHLYEQVG
jgi:hypothetical protein